MYETAFIANYFINKGKTYGLLKPLKLIKLVYIAYGWYLGLTNGKRLVLEHPLASDLGPMFPNLYDALMATGEVDVLKLLPVYRKPHEDGSTELAVLYKFLDKIWSLYGKYESEYLSALTHAKDTPWKKVHVPGKYTVIPDEILIEHYSKMLESNMNEQLRKKKIQKAEQEKVPG